MAVFRWSLCEADQAKYGIEGQHVFNLDEFADHPSSVLEAWEAQAGIGILRAYTHVKDGRVAGIRACVWFGIQHEGISDITYRDFDPLILQVDLQLGSAGGDVVPPDGDSSTEEEPSGS